MNAEERKKAEETISVNWIKSAERLPKPNYRKVVKEKSGRYNISTYRMGNPQSKRYWNETVEYWLDESNNAMPTEEEIEKTAGSMYADWAMKGYAIERFKEGVKWLRSRMKGGE